MGLNAKQRRREGGGHGHGQAYVKTRDTIHVNQLILFSSLAC